MLIINLQLKNDKVLFLQTLLIIITVKKVCFKVFLSVKVDIARENDASISLLKKKPHL